MKSNYQHDQTGLVINKFLLLLTAILLLFFVGNDYSKVSASKVSIITALAIDKSEEGFTLSAEIAPTTQNEQGGQPTPPKILSADGETIGKCINVLFDKTGWYPKLNNCSVVIISKEVAEDNVMNGLDYFLKSEKFLDSALLTIAEDNAKQVLLSTTGLDSQVKDTISKITFKKSFDYSEVVGTNIKDFAISYYDKGVDNVLSTIKLTEVSKPPTENGGEQSQSSPTPKEMNFDLSGCAIFSDGILKSILDKDQTHVLNYLLKDDIKSNLTVKNVSAPAINNGQPLDYELFLSSVKKDRLISFKNGVPTYEIVIELEAQITDTSQTTDSIQDLFTVTDIPKEVLSTANIKLTQDLDALFDNLKQNNSDILGIGKHLNANSTKEWKTYYENLEDKDNYMQDVAFSPIVFITAKHK